MAFKPFRDTYLQSTFSQTLLNHILPKTGGGGRRSHLRTPAFSPKPRLSTSLALSSVLHSTAPRGDSMKRQLQTAIYGVVAALFLAVAPLCAQETPLPSWLVPQEGDYVVHDFHFQSGETLPEVRLHYRTLGKPARDASGKVTNAVLILHGTGGSGRQFLQPQFAGELFGPGQLLDINRYFIVLP